MSRLERVKGRGGVSRTATAHPALDATLDRYRIAPSRFLTGVVIVYGYAHIANATPNAINRAVEMNRYGEEKKKD
jgi:hypothetical protein